MTVVSISKAARITGKARSTIHTYIKTGKLSKTTTATGNIGIDISELIRVFGELVTTDKKDTINQSSTAQSDQLNTDINNLKTENERLKILLSEKEERLQDKQSHIDSLKQALMLIEYKEKGNNETPLIHVGESPNTTHQDTNTSPENTTPTKPKRRKIFGIF